MFYIYLNNSYGKIFMENIMVATVEKEVIKEKNFLSITKLCEILSISETTAKNWIKLGKIKHSYTKNSIIYFSNDYVESFLKRIKSESSTVLKSRRNKKHISGSFFYKNYITPSSKNIKIISTILDKIKKENLNLSKQEIKYIIADCAIQLLLQKKQIKLDITKNFLYEYLNNNINLNSYNKLVNDLIDNKVFAINFVKHFPSLFKYKYVYEKNEDILGLLYISLSNLGNRKSKGAYYTPTKIVQKIINNIEYNDLKNKKILDPSCGSGNFLLQLPDNLCIENIYGNDIDDNAIKITRLNMLLKFNIPHTDILYKNFTNKDFLLDEYNKKFDYIIGNPPWGAEFSKETIVKLRKNYIATENKNIESYDIFIEKSLKCLNQNGYLFFVLPESVLSVKTHKTIRKIILNKTSIIYLEYLGNIFNKVQCPSIILQLKHSKNSPFCKGMKVSNKNNSFVISKERRTTPEVFSFSLNDEEYFIYEKILNGQNKLFLKDNAIFALGIVTGDNKKYISERKSNKNEIILKGANIKKFKIDKPELYIEYTPEKFQQVAPTKYYRANEKLLYKFISNKLVFAYDNEQTLSLNSCNILIPKLDGYNTKYILAILNSRIAQYIFAKKYNSIKVLRSHIESIPIPICDTKKQNELVKIIDKILFNQNNYFELYENLEEKIYQLYGLSRDEYNLIKKTSTL